MLGCLRPRDRPPLFQPTLGFLLRTHAEMWGRECGRRQGSTQGSTPISANLRRLESSHGQGNGSDTVMKNTKLRGWENGQLGIGFQFFNVFNHPNFGLPDGFSSSPTFGQIVYTASPPTGILGAGFVGTLGSGTSARVIQVKHSSSFERQSLAGTLGNVAATFLRSSPSSTCSNSRHLLGLPSGGHLAKGGPPEGRLRPSLPKEYGRCPSNRHGVALRLVARRLRQRGPCCLLPKRRSEVGRHP
jgi:hypothetical protein